MTAAQLGTVIVNAYSNYYGASGKETLSAISTSSLPAVATALDAFATEMSAAYPSHSSQITSVRNAVEHFEYEMAIDLYDLAQRTSSASITPQLTSASNQLMTSVQAAVLRETNGELRSGAHGLSVYFPDVPSDLNLVGYRMDILLTADTHWDEFLDTYFGGATSDQYEDDDTYAQASTLTLGVPQYHAILDGGMDEDWAKFVLTSATDLVIETSGAGGDTVLAVFDETGVTTYDTYTDPSTWDTLAIDDDSGVDSFSKITGTSISPGTYYVLVWEYGMDDEIQNYQLMVFVPTQPDGYEPNNDPSSAGQILLNSSQLHSIGEGGMDVDWSYFTLSSAQNVLIETWGTSGDTRIWLYEEHGSDFSLIDADDDTGEGLFSRLAMTDLPAGTYFIDVEEYYNDEEIASYYLNLSTFSMVDSFEPNDDYLHATQITAGQEQVHSIGDGGQDEDWFQFELQAESDIHIETSGYSGDTQLFLYGSDGTSEIEWDDDSGNGYFSLLNVSGLAPGDYYFKVIAYEGYSGQEPIPQYTVVLSVEPSAPTGAPGTIGMLNVVQHKDSIALSWAQPDDNGSPITRYHIYRGMASDGSDRAKLGESTTTSYTDSSVESGKTYYYWVVAENGNGQSSMPSATAATATDTGSDGTLLLIIGGVIAAIAAAIVVFLLLARGRKTPSREAGSAGVPPGPPPPPPQVRCPICGAPDIGLQFCSNCGAKLR
jgi:hypothetical protein